MLRYKHVSIDFLLRNHTDFSPLMCFFVFVSKAAEEARKEADSRAQGAEEELEQRRGELRDLEEKLRKAEEESNNRKARLDSFMKAMGSLQDDRDRVLNMYKQLEEKHLQVTHEHRVRLELVFIADLIFELRRR